MTLNGALRFNRYIVECKLKSYTLLPSYVARFNRYIVECKSEGTDYTNRYLEI